MVELNQADAVLKGNTGLQASALQCSDPYDNQVGIHIASNPDYAGVSCEQACATELGGYKSDDPAVADGTPQRPYGPYHPQGKATIHCEPDYKSYEADPASGWGNVKLKTPPPPPPAPPMPVPPPYHPPGSFTVDQRGRVIYY